MLGGDTCSLFEVIIPSKLQGVIDICTHVMSIFSPAYQKCASNSQHHGDIFYQLVTVLSTSGRPLL